MKNKKDMMSIVQLQQCLVNKVNAEIKTRPKPTEAAVSSLK